MAFFPSLHLERDELHPLLSIFVNPFQMGNGLIFMETHLLLLVALRLPRHVSVLVLTPMVIFQLFGEAYGDFPVKVIVASLGRPG